MTLPRLKILTRTQRSLRMGQYPAATMRIACNKSKYLEHFSRLEIYSELSLSGFIAFEFNHYLYHHYNLRSSENLFSLIFPLSSGLTF